jgi:hypothetical protein
MYGLLHKPTKSLVGFTTTAGGEEFCGDVEYSLSRGADNVWLVPTRKNAEKVANTNTEWYNRGYTSPENDYVGDLKVVEVVMEVQQ